MTSEEESDVEAQLEAFMGQALANSDSGIVKVRDS